MRPAHRRKSRPRSGFSLACRRSEQKAKTDQSLDAAKLCAIDPDVSRKHLGVQCHERILGLVSEKTVLPNHFPGNSSVRLADLCQKMEQFTFALAHDLRGATQLHTAYADLLAAETDGWLEPEQLTWLTVIKTGAKRIQDTVESGQAQLHELIRSKGKPQ
jgi:hypothetical protein